MQFGIFALDGLVLALAVGTGLASQRISKILMRTLWILMIQRMQTYQKR